MKNIFNFDKPKTAVQWLVFLAAAGIACTSPAGTRAFLKELLKYIDKELGGEEKAGPPHSFKTEQLSQALYRLKKRKIIEIKKTKNKTFILLSEKGKKRKLEYDFFRLTIPKPKLWDGKWRFLMFDITEKNKFAREALRERLKNLGFLKFQKSVWVYPYPCENEIDFIAENLGIAPHIMLLTVTVENDQPLRAHYNLPGI
jgi:DNA-binding transcriptional regulator PaaX